MLVAGQGMDAPSDFEFPIGRVGHALFVDRHGDDEGAMLLGQPENEIGFLAPSFEVERIEHRSAGICLQGAFEHVALGAVQHQWRLNGRAQALDDFDHLLRFVRPLGERDAHVQQVCAALDLVACYRQDTVIFVGEEQPLDLAAALCVYPLADQRWRWILPQFERTDRAGRTGCSIGHDPRPGRLPSDAFDNSLQMLEGGPAAPAHSVDAEIVDELGQRFGQAWRFERVQRLAATEVDRNTGIRNDADRRARVLDEVAHRLAHVLRAGRAVQTDHVGAQTLENGQCRADVSAEQHSPICVQRHLHLQWQAPSGPDKAAPRPKKDSLRLQDVLLGFDDQQIGPAIEQAAGLFFEDVDQPFELNVR